MKYIAVTKTSDKGDYETYLNVDEDTDLVTMTTILINRGAKMLGIEFDQFVRVLQFKKELLDERAKEGTNWK